MEKKMLDRRKALQFGLASTALGAATLAGAKTAAAAQPAAEQSYAEAEAEIRQLLAKMTSHYDLQEFDEMLACYTDDCEWNSPPSRTELRGKAAILADVSKTPKNRLVRHLMTNTIVDRPDPNHASARCYVVAGQNIGGHPLEKAVPMDGPPVFGEYHFKLRRDNGVWKIQRKETVEVFFGQVVSF